mmetsp:Transcript_12164/g.36528  ORF Transcript_12164/g.36528 Transcript_12164/m.36528 type:complete len:231 (-) Transcript_12164:1399-2091(-)
MSARRRSLQLPKKKRWWCYPAPQAVWWRSCTCRTPIFLCTSPTWCRLSMGATRQMGPRHSHPLMAEVSTVVLAVASVAVQVAVRVAVQVAAVVCLTVLQSQASRNLVELVTLRSQHHSRRTQHSPLRSPDIRRCLCTWHTVRGRLHMRQPALAPHSEWRCRRAATFLSIRPLSETTTRCRSRSSSSKHQFQSQARWGHRLLRPCHPPHPSKVRKHPVPAGKRQVQPQLHR